MEQTECSETSAYKLQKQGNYPKRKHTRRNIVVHTVAGKGRGSAAE
jgi:hypothetical protein